MVWHPLKMTISHHMMFNPILIRIQHTCFSFTQFWEVFFFFSKHCKEVLRRPSWSFNHQRNSTRPESVFWPYLIGRSIRGLHLPRTQDVKRQKFIVNKFIVYWNLLLQPRKYQRLVSHLAIPGLSTKTREQTRRVTAPQFTLWALNLNVCDSHLQGIF